MATIIDARGYDQFNRPCWDLYFMTFAFIISQKSIDPHTKHGCVLVSKRNTVLSTGYNGPIHGIDDAKMPSTRPEKYWPTIHSEENCFLSYNGSFSDLDGARIYITGEPCYKCLRAILQKGVKHIIHGHVASKCIDEEDRAAKKLILELVKDVKIEEYNTFENIQNLLNQTSAYVQNKAL